MDAVIDMDAPPVASSSPILPGWICTIVLAEVFVTPEPLIPSNGSSGSSTGIPGIPGVLPLNSSLTSPSIIGIDHNGISASSMRSPSCQGNKPIIGRQNHRHNGQNGVAICGGRLVVVDMVGISNPPAGLATASALMLVPVLN